MDCTDLFVVCACDVLFFFFFFFFFFSNRVDVWNSEGRGRSRQAFKWFSGDPYCHLLIFFGLSWELDV